MTELKLDLSKEFSLQLSNCDEVWIAVALISDKGLKFIQDNINPDAKQKFLVGIGLPTPPTVLRALKERERESMVESRIYHKSEEFFHPKVYMFRSGNVYTAFVGSGNCTDGGLSSNVEVAIKTDDKEFCAKLIQWFNAKFKHGSFISESFIEEYSLIFNRRLKRMEEDKLDVMGLQSSNIISKSLEGIDFTNQFFKKEHFEAFIGGKPTDRSDSVNKERNNVAKRLFKLNEIIFPIIQSKGWDLHEHYIPNDTVSSAVHGQYTADRLDGIWLHYGRSKNDIKAFGENSTPIDFMRLQVIVHEDHIGLWNRIGKDNGSRYDRAYIKDNLKNNPQFGRDLYDAIVNMPADFFVRVGGEVRLVTDFKDVNDLTTYLLKDDIREYFIIGRNFSPSDKRLSVSDIANTIVSDFEHLYRTYEILSYKLKY